MNDDMNTGDLAPADAPENNMIRSMVRGVYSLQHLRVQIGNRVTVNFKAKLGLSQDGMSEKELEKQEKKILDTLRESYDRITDAIATGKFPTPKKFKGDAVISTFAELVLVEQYMSILRSEEKQFDLLKGILEGNAIYDEFLINVRGVGPAIAGILLSEINIHKAEYPSSLWAYAGLDVVSVGKYTDKNGKERNVTPAQIDEHRANNGYDEPMYIDGNLVTMGTEGRSRREASLVQRTYTNKDGEQAVKSSISFNPFLKTKLIGVLGSSFLRSGLYTVDGDRMGAAKRLSLAKAKGFTGDGAEDSEIAAFLRTKGHVVVNDPGEYARAYYHYRDRLENTPRHKDKSDGHKHAMAVRFMVKRFLVDLYTNWRRLENLPVATEYSEGKLGIIHKKAA